MQKVLIPTDFSANARNAVKYGIDMFQGVGEIEFVLLNAYDIPHGGSNTMLVSINDILKRDSELGLKQLLTDLKNDYHLENLRTLSRHGELSSVIEHLLRQEDFDLIVMGTLGAGGLKKILIGSTTSNVVSRIERPILVVPRLAQFNPPDKILFTTDFLPTSIDLRIEILKYLSINMGSRIHILNVQEIEGRIELDDAIRKSGLESIFEGTDHTYHLEICEDDMIECIESFIQRHQIKMMAITKRHLRFIQSLFHKSLTKEMAMHTKIPMLALHG